MIKLIDEFRGKRTTRGEALLAVVGCVLLATIGVCILSIVMVAGQTFK